MGPISSRSKPSAEGVCVMDLSNLETEELLRRAGNHNRGANGQLFERHRNRLYRAATARLHPRVAARLDASDVVQRALGKSSHRRAPQDIHAIHDTVGVW